MSMRVSASERPLQLCDAAARCSATPEVLAIELPDTVDDGATTPDNGDPLEVFLGGSHGDGTAFEIHEARRELADRRAAVGIENL